MFLTKHLLVLFSIIMIVMSCNKFIDISKKETNPNLVGIWELIELEKNGETTKYDENKFREEITIDTFLEKIQVDELNFIGYQIGKSNYKLLGFDPETYKEEIQYNACDCALYINAKNPNKWVEECEGSIIEYSIQFKNKNLIMLNSQNNILYKYRKR